MKIFSLLKMGYETFFDYIKLSSALVPRIKNDHSLKTKIKIGTGKIVLADYAELLFRIWAFFEKQF